MVKIFDLESDQFIVDLTDDEFAALEEALEDGLAQRGLGMIEREFDVVQSKHGVCIAWQIAAGGAPQEWRDSPADSRYKTS